MNKESLNKLIDNTHIRLAPYIGSFLSKKPPKAYEVNNKNACDKISKY